MWISTLAITLDNLYLSTYNFRYMRNFISFSAFLILLTAASFSTHAQRAKVGCMDKTIRVQSEQIKRDFLSQGLQVYKDAMLSMDNREPYPVAIQLNAGQLYQFVFVGNAAANRLYFELFDGNDKKLAEKTLEKAESNKYIIYSFIPQKTDIYLLVLSQKVKKGKEICGSLTVMQKPEAAEGNQ